jgi:hypothetical protein
MKYLLLAAVLLLTAPVVHAQKAKKIKVKDNDAQPTLPTDADTHLVDYTGVVEVAGASQSDLYTRAFDWVAKNYPSASNALQDKDKGRLTVQGLTHPHYRGNEFGGVNHTFNIYVKDGKYKYDFTNFRHEFKGAGETGGDASLGPFENETPRKMMVGAGMLHRVWNSLRNETDVQIKELTASLELAMSGKTKDKSDF